MRTRMYGGVRGRKTKVGRKLSFSSYSISTFIGAGGVVRMCLSGMDLRIFKENNRRNKVINR